MDGSGQRRTSGDRVRAWLYPTEISEGTQVRVVGETLIVMEIEDIAGGTRRRFRFHDGSSAQFANKDRVFLPQPDELLAEADSRPATS